MIRNIRGTKYGDVWFGKKKDFEKVMVFEHKGTHTEYDIRRRNSEMTKELVAADESWNDLEVVPPKQFVEVLCDNNIRWVAEPTYYPFYLEKRPGDERKPYGFRATAVFYSDSKEKWDGGWLVRIGMIHQPVGNIIKWRLLK